MGSALAVVPGAVLVVFGWLSLGSGARVFCKDFPAVQPELDSSKEIARQVSNDFKC